MRENERIADENEQCNMNILTRYDKLVKVQKYNRCGAGAHHLPPNPPSCGINVEVP